MSATRAVDVLAEPCPTGRIETRLPLALIEEIDQKRGNTPRSDYLAMVIDAAMTREHPHLPEGAGTDGGRWIDVLAERNYRRHVRSVELARRMEVSN